MGRGGLRLRRSMMSMCQYVRVLLLVCRPGSFFKQAVTRADRDRLYTARQVQSAQSGDGAGPSAMTRGRGRIGPREDEDDDEEGGMGVGVERRSWQGAREGIAQRARADVGRLGFLKGLDWLPSERCFRWPNTASIFFHLALLSPVDLQCFNVASCRGPMEGSKVQVVFRHRYEVQVRHFHVF